MDQRKQTVPTAYAAVGRPRRISAVPTAARKDIMQGNVNPLSDVEEVIGRLRREVCALHAELPKW